MEDNSKKLYRYSSDWFEIWIDDGIVFYEYKEGLVVTKAVAVELVKRRIELCQGHVFPILVDATISNSISKEARKYLSGGDSIKLVSAGAIVVNNQIQKLLATAFLKINWSTAPAKVFMNKPEAILWLKTFTISSMN